MNLWDYFLAIAVVLFVIGGIGFLWWMIRNDTRSVSSESDEQQDDPHLLKK
jgi:flagellar basal body-associated protein FliL